MQVILQQLKIQFGERWASSLNGSVFSMPSLKVWFAAWQVRLVNLFAIILLASALAKVTWMVVSPENVALPKTNTTSGSLANIEPAARLRTISALHLFGEANTPIVNNAPIVAPETRLKLTLKGVFASTDSKRAFAIILDSNKKEKAYRLGSKVSGGAVLHAVYVDRVILKRNGRLETLRLATLYNKATSRNRTKSSSKLSSSRTPTKTIRADAKLKKLKQTLLKDPQKIWQQVRISPVLKNGSIKGYTVEHQDKQLMQSLTLQKGDVITEVNGQALSNPAALYGLMNQLSKQKNIDVTIERNGQAQTIQLQL